MTRASDRALGKHNHIEALAGSTGNVSRWAMTTAVGSGSPAGYWAKIATFIPTANSYTYAGIKLRIQNGYSLSNPASAEIEIFLAQHQTGLEPTSTVEVVSVTGGLGISHDSFKVIGGGSNGDPVELWMRKDTSYGRYDVIEVSNAQGQFEWSFEYHDGAAWQSTTPTGTVEITSDWASTGWTDLSLQNGWAIGTSGQSLRYRRSSDGWVIVDGYLDIGTYNVAINADALPVGFRPSRLLRRTGATDDNTTPGVARYYVDTNGLITCSATTGTSTKVAFNFSYPAEG